MLLKKIVLSSNAILNLSNSERLWYTLNYIVYFLCKGNKKKNFVKVKKN